MKFRPLHDRVVVRRIDPQKTSAGGIIIPDTVKEKPMEGEVIAVGPGARDAHGIAEPARLATKLSTYQRDRRRTIALIDGRRRVEPARSVHIKCLCSEATFSIEVSLE